MELEIVVEIPKGSRNKYEIDHETGEVWLDRLLFTATIYPTDYGFVPQTLSEDGDPLDVLVLLDEPTFPGCHIHARAVGVFWMEDEAGRDAKVLSVPSTDPRWAEVTELEHVPLYLRNEIEHFFEVYKDLEPGKGVHIEGWQGREAAEQAIKDAFERYAAQHADHA
jgi:inorganic pyrophosphatase